MRMKKWWAWLAVICLLVSLLPLTSVGTMFSAAPADDLSKTMQKSLIPQTMQGNDDRAVTRAEFCLLMANWIQAYRQEDMESFLKRRGIALQPNPFWDTDDMQVLYMYSLGLSSGVGKDRFAPDRTLSRQEAAVMLANLAALLGVPVQEASAYSYKDSMDMAPWAKTGIYFVTQSGILEGNAAGLFMPQKAITRKESYTALLKLYEYCTQMYYGDGVMRMGGHSIALGDSESYLIKSFGLPDARHDTAYGFQWYVYCADYTRLLMAGVSDGKVLALATNAKDFIFSGAIYPGASIKKVENGSDSHVRLFMDLGRIEGIFLTDGSVNSGGANFPASMKTVSMENFYFTNGFRVKTGLNPLIYSEVMEKPATAHSADMATNHYFSHKGSDGSDIVSRINKAKISWSAVGENIAFGYQNGFEAHEAFINSSEHRDNIVYPFGYMSVGIAADSAGSLYLTQAFVK